MKSHRKVVAAAAALVTVAALSGCAAGGGTDGKTELRVATFPPASSQRELVAQTDGALYDAKRGGKNRVARSAGVEQPG